MADRVYSVRSVSLRDGQALRVGPDDLIFLDEQTDSGLSHFVILERSYPALCPEDDDGQ